MYTQESMMHTYVMLAALVRITLVDSCIHIYCVLMFYNEIFTTYM